MRRLRLPFAVLILVFVSLVAPPATAAGRLSEAGRWLQEYLRIDTSNPPGFEHRAAGFLAYLLHRERIATDLFVTADGRVSLMARLSATPGVADGSGALVLTHHMDVVPAGEGWHSDPFAGELDGERLMGRGALDAKGLGIAQLAAFVELKRRQVPLRRDVVFLAVADEERGGGEGMAWLFEHHPELFDNVWAVINEGGSGRVVNGRLLWWEVEVAQKRPLWLEVSARGRGGHASNYLPSSAVHQLIHALHRLLEMPRPFRVTPAARDYLAALAPLHRGRNRELFADIDGFFALPEDQRPFLPPGIYKLFTDTVQVTVLEGSDSTNVVPTTASARVDIRLLPDTDADAFLERVTEALGDGVDAEVLVSAPPSPPSPADHPAFRAIAQGLEPGAVVPSLMAGYTDSRHFRQRGIPAYGVSPFAVEALDNLGIHGVDEGILLEVLDDGVERMRRLVENCATAPSGGPKTPEN